MDKLICEGSDVITVDYEEFILMEKEVLFGICEKLKLANTDQNNQIKLADQQFKIHNNVDKKVILGRIDGWKNELPVSDGIVVELIVDRFYLPPYFLTDIGLPTRCVCLIWGKLKSIFIRVLNIVSISLWLAQRSNFRVEMRLSIVRAVKRVKALK